MKRVRVGDIIEIATTKGLAYAQCTHIHVRYGHLIRILAGFHQTRPNSLGVLCANGEQFVTFCLVQKAVSKRTFEVVGHETVPKHAQRFPLFRAAGSRDPQTGRVHNWWLWDGERESHLGDLKPEQRHLPILGIWDDVLLVRRIAQGWTPGKDPS